MKKKQIIHWVCSDCGLQASNGQSFSVSTYHEGRCDICKKIKSVTEYRDFYYGERK